MKFLIDVCAASRSLEASLIDQGHDVLSVRDSDPEAPDATVLERAYRENRVLITEDKDFGELVFVHRLPHPCIVRFVEMRVVEKVAAVNELIRRHSDELRNGTLVVVTRGRLRFRYGRDDG